MSRFLPDRALGVAPGSVGDYRELARRRLPRQLFDYVDGGAFAESTLAANVADLAGIQLRQRVLRDVSDLTLSTTVLGQALALPVILGPGGEHAGQPDRAQDHRQGERLTQDGGRQGQVRHVPQHPLP